MLNKRWLPSTLHYVIITITLVITFMQGIYNSIPKTNHVSSVYSVVAVMYLRYVLQIMLFRMSNVLYYYISTFRSMCAVPPTRLSCVVP
jgi:hypothetical protein